MTTNYYSLFKEDTIRLCESMVVKSDYVAAAINRDLAERGFATEAETHKWKYFLNLAGEYHHTDAKMSVTSLDTLETIDFTKENLRIHKTTRNEYSLQSTYYEQLVTRYPEQEELIRGIINPVDINRAIAADDYTILNWDSSLLEGQEENIIPELQKWINAFVFRYQVDGYATTDNLYIAGLLGQMYLNMPAKVLNIRLSNCRTEMVHSFHIWSYLASHSAMDDFREYLTYKQAHWLYRNIRYLEANVGKEEVFKELVQNLLTERGLSLYGHRIEHVVDEISTGNQKPKARIRRRPINNTLAEDIVRTVPEMLSLESTLGIWNPENSSRDGEDITRRIVDSEVDSLPTRVLESEAVDLTGSLPITLADVLITQWLEWAATGRYRSYITVSNPFTNNTMRLSTKDAVIAYFYCYNKSHGRTLLSMPDVFCHRNVRTDGPLWTDAFKYVDRSIVDQRVVEDIVGAIPALETYTNTEDFYTACQSIMSMIVRHRNILGAEEDFVRHGEYGKAVNFCFRDYRANYGVTDITEWMITNGLSLGSLSVRDAGIIASRILEAVTGADVNAGQSLKEIQTAMLNAMRRLTSYDLQFIQTTNEIELKRTDWPTIRGGNIRARHESKITQDPTLDRVTTTAQIRHHLYDDNPLEMMSVSFDGQVQSRVGLDVGIDIDITEQLNHVTAGSSAPVRIQQIEEL